MLTRRRVYGGVENEPEVLLGVGCGADSRRNSLVTELRQNSDSDYINLHDGAATTPSDQVEMLRR